jgi:hypothetical protein
VSLSISVAPRATGVGVGLPPAARAAKMPLTPRGDRDPSVGGGNGGGGREGSSLPGYDLRMAEGKVADAGVGPDSLAFALAFAKRSLRSTTRALTPEVEK